MKAILLGSICACALALPALAANMVVMRVKATATIYNTSGAAIGHANFSETADGVMIDLHVEKLPPGVHAVHIHETGKCDGASGFKSAGGHFNPTSKQHGKLNAAGPHAGDMDNQTANAQGVMDAHIVDGMVSLDPGATSLFDADGSAIVIHAGADDYQSQPAGNAGERIACGVIERN